MPPPSSQGSQSRRPTSQPVRQEDEESEDDSDDSMQHVYTLEQKRDARLSPIKVHMELDHCSVPMEVDTGASAHACLRPGPGQMRARKVEVYGEN